MADPVMLPDHSQVEKHTPAIASGKETTSAEGYACAEEGGWLVGLDTTLTEALEREDLARELVRTVQEARKQAGLEVSDPSRSASTARWRSRRRSTPIATT